MEVEGDDGGEFSSADDRERCSVVSCSWTYLILREEKSAQSPWVKKVTTSAPHADLEIFES